MKAILYYIHDPMCSWCWGFSKTLNQLMSDLPPEVEVRRLLGGLAPDSDLPMPKGMQQQIADNWSRIEEVIPNVKFNFGFWQKNMPRRSTYPACRAVIAARLQGEENDFKMTQAIQRAYYEGAQNPSDNSTLIELANELGLNANDFEKALVSKEVNDALMQDINFSRELYVESYPSLVLENEKGTTLIKVNYTDSEAMLSEIKQHG